jgi:hypothetical protein
MQPHGITGVDGNGKESAWAINRRRSASSASGMWGS